MPNTTMQDAGRRGTLDGTRRFVWLAAATVLLAFLVREYFVLVTVVEIPIRGDIREYVKYAWNLHHHGIFSMAEPGDAIPAADGYRSPGFPWLLALCMSLRPRGADWYPLALQLQVLLGTMTVAFSILLARLWLARGWAIAAGLLLAVWPHHIAATGALLSEVAFGFVLAAGAYFLARALDGRRNGFLVLSALGFGYAYLVNPLIALFPPVIALLVWRENRPRAAMLFIGIFLVPVLALGLRNARLQADDLTTAQAPSRAAINVVQGSWPQYHAAWQAQRRGDPIGIAIHQEINHEIELLEQTPQAGASVIASRMARDPAYYAAWYLWRKPLLLWDWNIRIGTGGFYVLAVRNSPLETNLLLRSSSAALQFVNPLLSVLALLATVFIFVGGTRQKSWAPAPAMAVAALMLYLTAIHTVFQAEPRYANAYRGFEILMFLSLLQLLMAGLRSRKWLPGQRHA